LRALVASLVLAASVAAAPAVGSTAPGPAGKAIVGGKRANFDNWGFTAGIFRQGLGFYCGGSVVAPTKILTAAHCVRTPRGRRVKASKLTVITGRDDLRETVEGERIAVSAIEEHPGYSFRTNKNDFAVITLADATTAPAIALPSDAEAPSMAAPGVRVRVAGWGATNATGTRYPQLLRALNMFVRRNQHCRVLFRILRRLIPGYSAVFFGGVQICVVGQRIPGRRFGLTRADCFGDSGGPLVEDTSAGLRLVGVVSAGGTPICGLGPSIYARVSGALGFIQAAL
jgi:secreted trypsin-like serine protease